MKIFRFEVEAWDECEEKTTIDKGIAVGETYGDAANGLANMYTKPNGEDDIISMKLYEIESTYGVVFSSDLKEAMN